ncbi:hypothetical protein GGD55_002386 [Rhizobium giardinii]|uniref:Uncharacterized protein n=1 Tax=Rhizobium giardinii TaxID=56731 RepID=A0A7W8X8L5_9HYPH|nr:hypothetical protein [Rhizobium giardinii]
MISRAINQKTARHLAYEAFLDLARNLDCVGVEPRNDLGRPLFDGISPSHAGAMARQRGLRLLGLSEVYPFNDWSEERANAVETLIAAAVEKRGRNHQPHPMLQSTSMRPSAAMTLSTMARHPSAVEMSLAKARACRPQPRSAKRSLPHLRHSCRWTTTRAPSAAKRALIALPMPPAPPVTMTTLSVKRMIVTSCSCRRSRPVRRRSRTPARDGRRTR